jgi:mutator protein MutT
MTSPRASFSFCPECGQKTQGGDSPKFFECQSCQFRLYLNTTVAVAPLIFDSQGKLLLVRRARDPHRGKLGIPGGFVDPGESAEDALRRELFEELKLKVTDFSFLGGWPNEYPYRGVNYAVLDLYFLVQAEGELVIEKSEIQEFVWRDPFVLDNSELAFDSLKAALVQWRLQQANKGKHP